MKLDASGYRGELPEGHDGFGLSTVGKRGDELVDAETYAEIKAKTLQTVRGTVQADILKKTKHKHLYLLNSIRTKDDGRCPAILHRSWC